MTDIVQYRVALFQSVSLVMKAERTLKEAYVPFKLIPVPKTLSSECGICIRFLPQDQELIVKALAGVAEPLSFQELPSRQTML